MGVASTPLAEKERNGPKEIASDMSRVASKGSCHKCGANIRSGLDNDYIAMVARVDDEIVTRQGELLAVINGRRTYSLEGGRLYRREKHHYKTVAAAPYVEHRCWEPFPASWLAPPPPRPADHDDPPF